MLTVYGNLPVQKVISNGAQKVGDSISFEKVNIYGDFSTEQTNGFNMSYYIAIPYMCTLSFKDCENHASFNVNYGGAFVGGYLGVVNSGAIVPKTTLKVVANIGNIVTELQRKVSTLEGYIQYTMINALNNALNE